MKRILFVDDDPHVLQALQRVLRPMRHEWELAFAGSGADALKILAEAPFDAVVADMRMPGMDGAQLLEEVRKRHPQAVRIILSGYSDRESILSTVGPAHQWLSKPCDVATLKSTLARACALRDLLADITLKRLVSQLTSLPSLPSRHAELIAEMQSPHASLRRIGQIVSQDIGMSAKILQLVNSCFFGLRHRVSNPAQAAVLLGLDTLAGLVLSAHVFTQFAGSRPTGFSLERLWEHSIAVAGLAKKLTMQLTHQEQKVVENACTAGLLHDIGKLVLAANLPDRYAEVLALARGEHLPLWQAERETFGASHAEVGAYLLGLWGLPDPIVEATAFHHWPAQCQHRGFSALTAVHVANALEAQEHPTTALGPAAGLDLEYLAALGLDRGSACAMARALPEPAREEVRSP